MSIKNFLFKFSDIFKKKSLDALTMFHYDFTKVNIMMRYDF